MNSPLPKLSADAINIAIRQIPDLPGPKGYPLFGNLPQIKMKNIHRDIENWARRYGPLFRIRLGLRQVLVVADHTTINSILRDRPNGFRRSARLSEISREMGGIPGVFVAEGEMWRNQRQMVMASFAAPRIRLYLPHLIRVAQRLQRRWHEAAIKGQPIALHTDLKRYTVDAIAGLAFGQDVNTIESGDEKLQRHLDFVLAATFRRAMSIIPYWRVLRLPQDRQLKRSVDAIAVAIDGFIAQARKRMEADPTLRENPTNLLEAMLVAADAGSAGVSDVDVAGNVSTMLFAGEDTTANSLSWLIYLLHVNPTALRRAADEVRQFVPNLSLCQESSLASLEYLEACVNESMRLKPVAPFIAFEALHDTTVSGIHVPADTLVWCVLRHDSVDTQYVDDPELFRPERWLSKDQSSLSSPGRRVVLPFGAGPRVCPGRYLAMIEIKLAMASLLASFDILDVSTPDGHAPDEVMAFTMNPTPMKMRIASNVPDQS